MTTDYNKTDGLSPTTRKLTGHYSWKSPHSMQNHTKKNIRRANTCDTALKLLNEEITSDIQKHKQNLWKEHLDAHLDHRHNTHIIWKTIHGLSNRAPLPILNTSIKFNNKKNHPNILRIVSANNSQTLSNTHLTSVPLCGTTSRGEELKR